MKWFLELKWCQCHGVTQCHSLTEAHLSCCINISTIPPTHCRLHQCHYELILGLDIMQNPSQMRSILLKVLVLGFLFQELFLKSFKHLKVGIFWLCFLKVLSRLLSRLSLPNGVNTCSLLGQIACGFVMSVKCSLDCTVHSNLFPHRSHSNWTKSSQRLIQYVWAFVHINNMHADVFHFKSLQHYNKELPLSYHSVKERRSAH